MMMIMMMMIIWIIHTISRRNETWLHLEAQNGDPPKPAARVLIPGGPGRAGDFMMYNL